MPPQASQVDLEDNTYRLGVTAPEVWFKLQAELRTMIRLLNTLARTTNAAQPREAVVVAERILRGATLLAANVVYVETCRGVDGSAAGEGLRLHREK